MSGVRFGNKESERVNVKFGRRYKFCSRIRPTLISHFHKIYFTYKFNNFLFPTLSHSCSWLAEKVSSVVNEVSRDNPNAHQPLVELIDGLKKKYSVPGAPWDIMLPVGSGTFGSYVPAGSGCGASADGRRSGTAVASDISAAPTPLDLPATPKSFEIYK